MRIAMNNTVCSIKGLTFRDFRIALRDLPKRECVGDEYQELGCIVKDGVIVARHEPGPQGCPGCKLLTSWEARDLCVQSSPDNWNGLCAYL